MLALVMDYEAAGHTARSGSAQEASRCGCPGRIGFSSWTHGQDHLAALVEWTESLKDWMGYACDSYYCGDGGRTRSGWTGQHNLDGSRMTSAEWVADLTEEFEDGSQLAFYTDHGWTSLLLGRTGLAIPEPWDWHKDSTFDNFDVQDVCTAIGPGFCHRSS